MSDFQDYRDYDAERHTDKQRRAQRREELTSGVRGADGLTSAEWALLTTLRQQGLDIRRSWMLDERSGRQWQHQRAIQYAS